MSAHDAQILAVEPEEYFKRPGLSSSIAKVLLAKSALHAFTEHPFYGDQGGDDPKKSTDRGAVCHTLALGKGKRYEVLDFKDWRTDKAKAAKAAAREEGKVPILAKDYAGCEHPAAEVTKQLAKRGVKLEGRSELAVEWLEDSPSGEVRCRGMLDHLVVASRALVLDLKFVESAAPSAIERSAENFGYALQHAAYTRAVGALYPDLVGRVDFLFCFCEAEPPYAVNICQPDGVFKALGESRWKRAVEAWGACLATDTWPAYGAGINKLCAPPWAAKELYA